MKRLTIKWQRLVEGGRTCPRCGDTGEEVRRASASLGQALAPLGIEVVLEEAEISGDAFKRQPLESNRILLEGRSLEEWLGAQTGQSPCCDVCGRHECRTVNVDGQSHETVPADLIVRAGLLAAAELTGKAKDPSCCGPAPADSPQGRCCS